ncbi:MAG: hypothetical protein R3Y44_00110 [Rikenellaceae bacterium]
MKQAITLDQIREACDAYLYHIAIRASRGTRGKNKIVTEYYKCAIIEVSKFISGVSYPEDMANLSVRVITPDNRFAYIRFGCFFFVGYEMYIISENQQYTKYHTPEVHNMDERLTLLDDSTTYTVPVVFAGIYTGIEDKNGESIFTEDIVKAVHSWEPPTDNSEICGSTIKGCVAVRPIGNDNGFVVMLDNHCAFLSNCYTIEKIDTRRSSHHPEIKLDLSNNKKNNNMKLTINELLAARGITEKDGVKFLRHKFSKGKDGVSYYNIETETTEYLEDFVTIEDFYRSRNEDFMKYQNTQLTLNFKGVNYIVSFIAESGTRARFVGVYKLEGEPIYIGDTPTGESKSYYNFVEIDILKDLKERIIIDWGKGAIKWHQKIENQKEIIMIGDPLGDLPFPGYMDFTLSRQELERVFEFEYKEWKNALTAVNCIYLITDNHSGKHYVGSTYNTDGIWGRWSCYATTIHGNNKELIKLIDSHDE